MFERCGDGKKLTERIPAQVVFLDELLDMFRRRATGTGFEKPATIHQRHDRKHLRAGADFEDREKVGEVIAQHIAGDGDRVFAFHDALEAEEAGVGRCEDADVEALGVVVLEVGFDLGDELRVVGACAIEPEDCGRSGGTRAVDSELHPILHRCILRLAGAPDVAGFDFVREQDIACGIGDADRAGCRDFKCFVVRAVFLGGLCHEADIRHRAHRLRIERAVAFAEIDHRLINTGVG